MTTEQPIEREGLLGGDGTPREAPVFKGAREPNWPPWPKPILYHDIRRDIGDPPSLRNVVRIAYGGWFLVVISFLWNLVAMGSVMAVVGGSDYVLDFVLAIAYLLAVPPVTFLIYRMLYNAARLRSTTRVIVYFILLALQVVFFIICLIGVNHAGASGITQLRQMVDRKQHIPIIFQIVMLLLWLALIGHNIATFVLMIRQYKHLGGLNQTQAEVTQLVQEAAVENREALTSLGEAVAKSAWDNRDTLASAATSASSSV